MTSSLDVRELYGSTIDISAEHISLREHFPHRPTLFIGLGGTGAKAVSKIKALFERVYLGTARRESEAQLRIPSMYAFRAYDTSVTERPPNLSTEEWHHIGVRDLPTFYQTNRHKPMYRDWLCQALTGRSIENGTGGFRNLGKLAFYYNMDRIAESLESAWSTITAENHAYAMQQKTPVIYVLCSLSGGTGSGALLDACFYLRRNFPGAQVVGVIAMLEGLPTQNKIGRERIRRGTFAALREIDAFMRGDAPQMKVDDPRNLTFDLPFNYKGVYEAPFTWCYLLQPANDTNQTTLPSHGHVTSYIARFVFAATAYAYVGRSEPDFQGILDNEKAHLLHRAHGAAFHYATPGFGQIHFPVRDCVKVWLLDATRDYLRHQRGGTAYDHDTEAAEFRGANDLDFDRLRARIARRPGTQESVQPGTYDDKVGDHLDGDGRYDEASRVSLLAYGQKMPAGRLREIEGFLGANVDDEVARLRTALQASVRQMLADERYLYLGARDFIDDLRRLVADEILRLRADDGARVAEEYDALSLTWQEVEPLVVDVTTDSGIVDRVADRFKIARARETYIAFLNRAEVHVLRRALNNLTERALRSLVETLDDLHRQLAQVFERGFEAAERCTDRARQRPIERLATAAAGQGNDTDHIRSVSALTETWRRQRYLAAEHYRPANVLAKLVKSGWNPMDLVEMTPPVGKDLGEYIAETLTAKLLPYAEGDMQITPLDIIAGVDDGGANAEVAQRAASVIADLVKPQMVVTPGHKNLESTVHSVLFCGGIDDETVEALKKTGALDRFDFIRAHSWETGQFAFFAVHLPVAMAGCTRIKTVFESEYDTWIDALRREREGLDGGPSMDEGLLLCFPGSDRWPSPTAVHSELSDEQRLFALALALSEMFTPDDADEQLLARAGKGPKTRRYGIYQVGNSQFWLSPFFTPRSGANATDRPVKLGSNVVEAFAAFKRDEQAKEHARGWTGWLRDNWSTHMTRNDLQSLADAAIATFEGRRAKTTDRHQEQLWNELVRVVNAWKDVQ